MSLAGLLEDDVTLLDHHQVDLTGAGEATYVVSADITYEYPAPIRSLRHQFVVVPRRRHGDQRRILHHLRADVPDDAVVRHGHDRFGNPVVDVDAPRVSRRFSLGVRAVLQRSRHAQLDRSPWRPTHHAPTPLTAADPALRAAAAQLGTPGDPIAAIGELVHTHLIYELGSTTIRTTAADAWSLRRGVCQDMAHVMIAMCRSRGIAARYVSGHLLGEGASHAWVEARDHSDRTIAYDPTHGRRTDLRYVTVAVGRDYRDVAPTAGTYRSGPRGQLSMRKRVAISMVA